MIYPCALAAIAAFPANFWAAKVGSYTVAVKRNEQKETDTLQLIDKQGRSVTTVTSYRVGVNDDLWHEKKPQTRDLNRDGIPEVLFSTWTGGAHGGMTYFIWSLGKTPRCLLAYDKNNGGDNRDLKFVDLDGDGVTEILSWYDGFAYTVGGSYWEDMPVVLRLENGRYVDRTNCYPKILSRSLSRQWSQLTNSDPKATPGSQTTFTSCLVNLVALGEMSNTRRDVMRRLENQIPSNHMRWLKKLEPTIASITRGRTMRYQYPKAYHTKPIFFPPFPTEVLAGKFEK